MVQLAVAAERVQRVPSSVLHHQGVEMPRESTQQKLSRVRKPRVHITYEVDTGNAIEAKELPFVVGVLADLSGQPKDGQLAKMRDRKFVEIDRDNFDQMLAGSKPRLQFRVPNRLADDDSSLGVELEFNSMDDFGPEAVARQVEPLRKLVEARERLNELALRVNASDKLEDLLQDVLQNTEALKTMSDAAGTGANDKGKETENG
jgi:type VI secretion system protein ImpB